MMKRERLEKKVIPMQAQILRGAKGEFPDKRTLRKVDALIYASLLFIDEFVYDYDYVFKGSKCKLQRAKMDYIRNSPDEEQKRPTDGYKMVIYVEDIEESVKLNAFAKALRCEFHIPQKTMDKLPDNLPNLEVSDLKKNEKDVYEFLLNHFLHEILHMFGAYHDKSGIMSGVIKMFNENNEFKLVNELDQISSRIVSESLYSQIIDPPFGDYEFDKNKRTIRISSDVEIKTVVFIKDSYYTNRFYFTKSFIFQCLVPEDSEWDTLLVQYLLGGILIYDKEEIYKNGAACRLRSR
uniref:SprT-like domain-containing protein n=1 Tax=Caenorhabditis tropicalis TaxID=1561998 RepID=A0A1I7TCQ6_9PELO